MKRYLSTVSGRIFEPVKIQYSQENPSKFKLVPLTMSNKAALYHFDQYYKQIYGSACWSVVRASLLIPPKQAMLINCINEESDLFVKFFKNFTSNDLIKILMSNQQCDESDKTLDCTSTNFSAEEAINLADPGEHTRQFLARYASNDITNLNEFMPPTELITENEMYTRESDSDHTFYLNKSTNLLSTESMDLDSLKMTRENINLPKDLRVLCLNPGSLINLPNPMCVNNQFNYYPVGLDSVLTILTLGLEKGDRLLNLSTFSGTKSLIALKTGLLDHLVCVTRSQSRIEYVQQVLRTHGYPNLGSETHEPKIKIIDSNELSAFLSTDSCPKEGFNKILVNVPCSNDRYALTTHRLNIFSPGQTRSRLSLQQRQLDLLHQAMRLCSPGGHVIYTTCTLSLSQNQTVIQTFIRKYGSTLNFSLVDLTNLHNLFMNNNISRKIGLKTIPINLLHSFTIHNTHQINAIQILPVISCNYGPRFICKFKRLD